MSSAQEARRQAAVLQALWGIPLSADTPWREQDAHLRAGLAAYQGNARATAERALAAAYPTVQALLGEEALALVARQLWRHHPPAQGDLSAWGHALPAWLAAAPEVRDWPYLSDCARLDWARHTAEQAGDAVFESDSLALLGTRDPSCLRIELQPGLSVIRSEWPVVQLWQAHQADGGLEGPESPPHADRLDTLRQALLARQPETAVVWRPRWRAEVFALPQAMAGWMSGLRPSSGPAPTLSRLLDGAPADFDLADWLALALRHGWIWRVSATHITDRAG